MGTTIQLGEISVVVVRKDIKHVHLSVYPPTGNVRISAPSRMKLETIRVFALTKLGWIRQQQKKFRAQERETPRDYIQRESHYLWGKRYLLTISEADHAPTIEINHNRVHLEIRPGTDHLKRETILSEWYRDQLREAAAPLIAKWEGILGVKVASWRIQRMKTKWGSCNTTYKRVLLNLELAKKPEECLEYIILHELAHLIERRHNERFIAILDHHMPHWRSYRQQLNSLPLDPQSWNH